MSDAAQVSARLRAALSDRYRVDRELGAGGMATVYLAHDLKHERDVAIKVVAHPFLTGPEWLATPFLPSPLRDLLGTADVIVDGDGHEQFFAARDAATGVQFGFISRTGHRVGVSAANVLALFDTLSTD